jgi:riboflavin kinase
MSDLKIQHILTLTQLLSKGARYNFVQVTSSSLGKSIKKSQQAASTYLLELENNGLIERIMKGRKISVKITQKGYSEIAKLNSVLSSSLSSSASNIELSGSVISGLGEGSYYMSLKGYTKQ